MLDYFKYLLKLRNPHYIIFIRQAKYREISAITAKWVEKDGKCYQAVSYMTDAWIAKRITGPMPKESEGVSKLEDVATIRETTDLSDIPADQVSAWDIYAQLERIEVLVSHQVNALFKDNPFGHKFRPMLILSPFPAVLLRVYEGPAIIGTIVVLRDGTISLVFGDDSRLQLYINRLRQGSFIWEQPALLR